MIYPNFHVYFLDFLCILLSCNSLSLPSSGGTSTMETMATMTTMATMATYNSFREQIGYCRMQSFDTVSRSTSSSPKMFLDNLVDIGVGLSSITMKSYPHLNLCGACLNITFLSDSHFPLFNEELTEWTWPETDNSTETKRKRWEMVGMVFDECTDPICTDGFLDFDIYSSLQPVEHGNPVHISWQFMECPVRKGIDFIEYLICFASTCHQIDRGNTNRIQLPLPSTYFWSLTLRNMRIPFQKVWANGIEMQRENAWVQDNVWTDFQQPIFLTLLSQEGKLFKDVLYLHGNLTGENQTRIQISESYHQGLLVSSWIQN